MVHRYGHYVKQKTDDECYCCQEHKLLTELMDYIQCINDKNEFEQYVACMPSLEMTFIDAITKKHVRGPAPPQQQTVG